MDNRYNYNEYEIYYDIFHSNDMVVRSLSSLKYYENIFTKSVLEKIYMNNFYRFWRWWD